MKGNKWIYIDLCYAVPRSALGASLRLTGFVVKLDSSNALVSAKGLQRGCEGLRGAARFENLRSRGRTLVPFIVVLGSPSQARNDSEPQNDSVQSSFAE